MENTPEFNFLKTVFVKDAEHYRAYLQKEASCRVHGSINEDGNEYRVIKKLRKWVGNDFHEKCQGAGYLKARKRSALDFITIALKWCEKNVNHTDRVRISRLIMSFGDSVLEGDIIAIADFSSFATMFRLDEYHAEDEFKQFLSCHIHGLLI
ncbi:hypothetical protein B9Z55_024603 [Caenorhabditis nigoni]|uniref:Uncharacterized protein n=1 Tax=Caenorhabditis nigoni TaxID=1611254 RepID=A0A2G5SVK1_9PELO|nr:hypothetical protein B9Z55_024603 [Caenorhabditis nigoni]